MATEQADIISGDESEIHNEPHIPGSRITVQYIQSQSKSGGYVRRRWRIDTISTAPMSIQPSPTTSTTLKRCGSYKVP